jgi:hypothetical protein
VIIARGSLGAAFLGRREQHAARVHVDHVGKVRLAMSKTLIAKKLIKGLPTVDILKSICVLRRSFIPCI